jgi:hypothetical protein
MKLLMFYILMIKRKFADLNPRFNSCGASCQNEIQLLTNLQLATQFSNVGAYSNRR